MHARCDHLCAVRENVGNWQLARARKVSNGTAHAENFPPGPKTRHTYQAPKTNKELKGQISLEPLLVVFGEVSLA